jgi:hypothetical protein
MAKDGRTEIPSKEYRANYDAIFKKKKKPSKGYTLKNGEVAPKK